MGFLGRLIERFRSFFGSAEKGVRAESGVPPIGRGDPRRYLSGTAPGYWSSNHREETQRCEGWQFVAVRTLARMCSQATLEVKEVGTTREKSIRTRKALRLAKLLGDVRGRRKWARKLAQLKREAKGGAETDRTVGRDHPVWRLMNRVNPEWSLSTFLFAAVQQLSLTGSCLVWCVRDPLGQPAELYVLPTGLCTMQAPSPAFPHGSYYLAPLATYGLSHPESEFEQGTLGGALMAGRQIDFRDVKAIRWPHPLYLSDGLSPLHAIRLWVDVANQMDRATWAAMENGIHARTFFEQDPSIHPEEAETTRFVEEVKEEYAGVHGAGRPILLPRGVKPPSSRMGDDVDFPNGRPSYRDMSLAAHGLSHVACGLVDAASLAAYRAALKQTTELTVQPTLTMIAGELSELVGGEFDGPECMVCLDAVSVNDPAELEQRLRTDLQAGNVLTVDEYRAQRDLPPLGGELGKRFAGQKVAQPGGQPGKPEPGETDDPRQGDGGRSDPIGDEQPQAEPTGEGP